MVTRKKIRQSQAGLERRIERTYYHGKVRKKSTREIDGDQRESEWRANKNSYWRVSNIL